MLLLLKCINVHVYEADRWSDGAEVFLRISCFNAPAATRTIHVLFQGGVHYAALQVTSPGSLSPPYVGTAP
jgi:hypothetical protein